MRLWTFSDLHLDARANAPDPLPRAPASFDVVVVAGDLSSPLTAALDWLHERLPGVPVVYVAGNHDTWCGPDAVDRYTLDDQMLRGRELAVRHGISLLEDDDAVIGGVRFLGATLWSDLRLTARLTTMDPARVVGRGMLDYRRIRRRRSGRHHYVRPSDLLARHHASRAWLETELARSHDGPTVVVTHHAPHPMSLPDAHDLLVEAYASDLSATMLRHGPTFQCTATSTFRQTTVAGFARSRPPRAPDDRVALLGRHPPRLARAATRRPGHGGGHVKPPPT